jgi:urea transport system permease protein
MQRLIPLFSIVFLLATLIFAGSPAAHAVELAPLVEQLKKKGTSKKIKTIQAIAASGNERAAPILEAYLGGKLFMKKDGGTIVMVTKGGEGFLLSDLYSGKSLGTSPKNKYKKIRVNNRLRGVIRSALASLQLLDPDRSKRLAAAASMFKGQDPKSIPNLQAALKTESDNKVIKLMREALAAAQLSGKDTAAQLAAIKVLENRGDQLALTLLQAATTKNAWPEVKLQAESAARRIKKNLAFWGIGQTIFYGLSLGSVLLLAAIGLAITFGVMGVINMAHGEMIMIGAYTTFVVQEFIRTSMPALFDVSLLIALPLAFLIAGGIGVAIERGIIRFLYGRPLETLLATWGISLVLQQAVRSIFGPTNQEVGNPSWMSGSFEVGHLVVTNNRLWIIVFALGVLFSLMAVLKYTSFGLRMRAVTQNRSMAGSMGIRTGWVDALTFGLGSGVAGIAGVALSQIDNVSPNLGQAYIVDSFMVVVFGGVGNLWGTLVGAVSLGVLNKFLEPVAGAVLGKIFVLVLIILFIQKRPRGLFAQKGRAVES